VRVKADAVGPAVLCSSLAAFQTPHGGIVYSRRAREIATFYVERENADWSGTVNFYSIRDFDWIVSCRIRHIFSRFHHDGIAGTTVPRVLTSVERPNPYISFPIFIQPT
jgi:hypothetical protein